jgi:ABC-type siderophore export system fused ATPase/permease subunit
LSAASSASRSCQSPSRMRPSAPCCQSKCASLVAQSVVEHPVFNYIVDARKGKKSAGQIENIRQLRLLSSRYLQWRFVNAHSEETLSHKNSVEVTLATLCYLCSLSNPMLPKLIQFMQLCLLIDY